MKRRIIEIRKQSRDSLPKSDIWFFSEDSYTYPTPKSTRKELKSKQQSDLMEDRRRNTLDYFGNRKQKRESLFVVDWQIANKP